MEAQPQGAGLLPCPFAHTPEQLRANSDPPVASKNFSEDGYWCVLCLICKASTAYFAKRENAERAWNTRVDLPRATADADGDVPRGFWPTLVDRGDGVEGHYCIGRLIEPGKSYWEFWNHGKWLSSGQVYVGKSVALAALANIRATPRATRETTVEACLAELRELGLEGCVTSKIKTTGRAEWMITIGGYFGHFQGSTLDECMIEIRAWSSKSAPLHRLKQRGEKGR